MEWGGVGTGYGERGGEGKEADVGKGQVGRAGRHVPHVQINKYFLVFDVIEGLQAMERSGHQGTIHALSRRA